jgi:phenylalanyl-tRNA synthetase beta chain
MKISYNWLKEYINIDLPPGEVSAILTNTGLEVEGMEEFESIKGGLAGCVVGLVKTCEPHPDADRLSVCTVDIGGDSILPVVCGAPNVKAGQKVVFAPVGTTLYNGDESITIKKVKIRGEVSEGMICAEDEIGLGEAHEGIILLKPKTRIGTPAREYFKVETDTVFELGLTPNRIDGASHIGVARDLAAFLSLENKTGIQVPSSDAFKVDNHDLEIPVIIENTDACKRYAGITISGVRVEESPDWLKNRLRSIGQNPINNIVDITNFVLHELGQPLHAFDADKIEGNAVHVKTLKAGSKFITLDEEERNLSGEDLMICNTQTGMCIAGVFGGIQSGVSEKTRNIFLESAYFDPVFVRRTARLHGLNTDASFRFERGVDPEMVLPALKRAAILIRDIAGGQISSDIVDEYPVKINAHKVEVTYANIDRLIGKEISRKIIHTILSSLDILIEESNSTAMQLTVPAYRVDVTREADVIEEILRIYGYNNVEFRERILSVISHTEKPDKEKLQQIVSNYLSSNGFNEIMCNSLSREEYFGDDPASVELFNPLSSDLNRMRTTLLYGGLEAIQHNVNRRRSNLKLYEFGNTYNLSKNPGKDILSPYLEAEHLALLITGNKNEGNWLENDQASSFYDLKAIIENILKRLGVTLSGLEIQETAIDIFSEGLTYTTNQNKLLECGVLTKSISDKFEIPSLVYYCDINWKCLVDLSGDNEVTVDPVPRFPEVRRDLSMIISKSVHFSRIQEIAFKVEKALLKSVSLFDVYESEKLGKGKKSYAVNFTLQSLSKTLTDKEIDKIMRKIQSGLEQEIDAEIRQATV